MPTNNIDELIIHLRRRFEIQAADAIESLVRERDALERKMNARKPAAIGYAKRLDAKLSAIRAAVEAQARGEITVLDMIRVINDEVVGSKMERTTDHFRDATKKLEQPAQDSREAFDFNDLSISTYCTGSAWARKENGVRITHTPTGIFAESHEDRSVHLNKVRALEKLKAALAWRDSQPQAEPVGVVSVDEFHGIGMNPLIPWEKIPLGTKLFTYPPDAQAKIAELEAQNKERNND